MQIAGSSAVVTGGSGGLGEAVARALAGAGARVAIFDMKKDRGTAVAAEIGGIYCNVDVTDDVSVEAGFDKARLAHGQERVLVNCAGIGTAVKSVRRDKATGEIKQLPVEDFNRIIQVNLVGTFRCIVKSAAGMLTLPVLDDGERGVIVNTASVAAEDGQMGQASYSASKGGVLSMTLPIARDLASEGVRVNTILPGIFHTPMMDGAPENVLQALADAVPFPRRLGRSDEFASLTLEMVRNAYFNGEDVRLDGALRLGPR